ncbi:hypothetical protein Nepgr_019093 [Nepenthes gracilis]|uniref:AT-hook motif nuclear-localized protein n=1 Tax=Nepenthes gracilis TaxID=150966 RepID=A0AAD3SV84_NEPGR|nr:hypothetical protein Nepgr_019093 [Nepenthes gracilis]
MDRKESMLMSGSSYYTQRGVPDLHGKQGIHPLTSSSMPFQLNSGGSSSLPALVAEPNSVISPDVMNADAPSAQPFNAPVRRKRGRPRKYGPDGTVSLALLPSSANLHPQGMKTPTQKRGRGRPPGTGRKQQLASFGKWPSGSAGVGFTPHIITIAAGEDIAANIISFAQQGPRAVCILSVNGAVSTVTLRQPSTPAGSITYEGRFEILSMSGSFLLMDNDGFHGPTIDMSISLASPDGRVIGGGVGGMLIAATPVQVILGSFIWGSSKMKHKMGKRIKVGGDSGHHSADNVVAPASIQQSQTPTSSMGAWPSPQAVDLQNAHFDIDLMHG